jgi:hypothetical protein
MKNLGMWAVIAFVGFLIGKSVQTEKRAVNDVLVKNVDALASDVDSDGFVSCYSSGKVDCLGDKVAYKLFDPNGLGNDHETE